jgi:eukaryotic-like serine/threonine-protein kinase
MEYVDGTPIDTSFDGLRLYVAARLKLFQTVCTAVHYAHQNLIHPASLAARSGGRETASAN